MASGDHRLAQIAEYGEVHVVVWEGHPLASRLESATVAVYRLPWPTTANAPVAPSWTSSPELLSGGICVMHGRMQSHLSSNLNSINEIKVTNVAYSIRPMGRDGRGYVRATSTMGACLRCFVWDMPGDLKCDRSGVRGEPRSAAADAARCGTLA